MPTVPSSSPATRPTDSLTEPQIVCDLVLKLLCAKGTSPTRRGVRDDIDNNGATEGRPARVTRTPRPMPCTSDPQNPRAYGYLQYNRDTAASLASRALSLNMQWLEWRTC